MSANAASKSAKALSKTEILNQLAEKTGLWRLLDERRVTDVSP